MPYSSPILCISRKEKLPSHSTAEVYLLFETGKATKHDQMEILKHSVNPILF